MIYKIIEITTNEVIGVHYVPAEDVAHLEASGFRLERL